VAAILNISAILNCLETLQAIFDLSWSRLQKYIMNSVLIIIAHGTLFCYKLNPTTYYLIFCLPYTNTNHIGSPNILFFILSTLSKRNSYFFFFVILVCLFFLKTVQKHQKFLPVFFLCRFSCSYKTITNFSL
jgi:hypothetical protein